MHLSCVDCNLDQVLRFVPNVAPDDMRIMKIFRPRTSVLLGCLACTLHFMAGCGSRLAGTAPEPPAQIAATPIVDRANVIIFLPDALRADHVGAYGYETDTTPNIDAWAQKAFVFENCYSQAPWTKPSVAAMLTGYVSEVHQAVASQMESNDKNARVQILRDIFDTLPERFQAAGYQTAMFMMNGHCQREYGFAQGIDHYWFRHFVAPDLQMNEALTWLEGAAGEPFFMYIHLRDPHGPYEPPADVYANLFGEMPELSEDDRRILENYGAYYGAATQNAPGPDGLHLKDLSPEGLTYLKNNYDAEIRSIDTQFQRLLDKLTELGIQDRTYIAFTSDHGEEFNERGNIGHGRSLHNELLHVPLILGLAGGGAGTRVGEVVRMFDLYPTLLTVAGLEAPADIQAGSLFTEDGKLAATENRLAFSARDKLKPDQSVWWVSLIDGYLKVIYYRDKNRYDFFNLGIDPLEKASTPAMMAFQRDALLKKLEAQVAENKRLAEKFGPPEWNVYDEETEAQLRALGYLE